MHILLATDGSPGAINAGKMVASFAQASEARVTLVAVTPWDETLDADRLFAPLECLLADAAIGVERELRHGVPAEELLRAETALAPDLTVVGSRGHSAP